MTRASSTTSRSRRISSGTRTRRRHVAKTWTSSLPTWSAQILGLWERSKHRRVGAAVSVVVAIAVLVGLVGARVMGGDGTPTSESHGVALAASPTTASLVASSPAVVPPLPSIIVGLTPLATIVLGPGPAATATAPTGASPVPEAAGSPISILTPYPTASPALATLRPDRVPPAAQPATVTEIVDGDTIRVRILGSIKTVQLIGIDAPEGAAANDSAECFGAEAASRTAGKIPVGSVVWLEAGASKQDQSGRLLRYIWFVREANGRTYMLNERLLAEGYAVIATEPPHPTYAARFQRAQTLAQDEGRGLWSACDVT